MCILLVLIVFFFKQKTAYEMRISDWSSDVCSSDLSDAIREDSDPEQEAHNQRYAREYEGHTARAAATGQPGNVNNVGIHSRPGKGGRPSRSVWTKIGSASCRERVCTYV